MTWHPRNFLILTFKWLPGSARLLPDVSRDVSSQPSVKQRLKCLSCIYQGISDGMKRVAVKISRDDLSRRGWQHVGKSCRSVLDRCNLKAMCRVALLFQNQPPVEYLPISCCQIISPCFLSIPYQNTYFPKKKYHALYAITSFSSWSDG